MRFGRKKQVVPNYADLEYFLRKHCHVIILDKIFLNASIRCISLYPYTVPHLSSSQYMLSVMLPYNLNLYLYGLPSNYSLCCLPTRIEYKASLLEPMLQQRLDIFASKTKGHWKLRLHTVEFNLLEILSKIKLYIFFY